MRAVAPVALLVVAAVASGCKRVDIVGTLGCATSRDCSPPNTICSADGRCVALPRSPKVFSVTGTILVTGAQKLFFIAFC